MGHTLFPENPSSPRFNAVKFVGQATHISCISPTFTGDKLKDLRLRRSAALDATAEEIAIGEKNAGTADIQAKVAIAKEAYQECLTYGGPGDGPKRSVLHFCGRWLPL